MTPYRSCYDLENGTVLVMVEDDAEKEADWGAMFPLFGSCEGCTLCVEMIAIDDSYAPYETQMLQKSETQMLQFAETQVVPDTVDPEAETHIQT